MSELYLTICYKPLTLISPTFYGTGVALTSYSYPQSRIIPTIYTVAGASLTLISELTDYNPSKLEELIETNRLLVYGVYVKARDLNERPLVPFLALKLPDGRLKPPRPFESGVNVYLPRAKSIVAPRDSKLELALAELTPRGVNMDRIYRVQVMYTRRVGIRLNKETRTVREPASIYSYTGIEQYAVCSQSGRCTNLVEFCVDIHILDETLASRLEQALRKRPTIIAQDLGGEQSVAKPSIEISRQPSLLARLSNASSDVRLAVSHVALDEDWSTSIPTYRTIRGEEIEAYIGRIELVSGWQLRTNKPKPPVLALAPGSIYWIKHTDRNFNHRKWWYKLLTTSIPIP